LAGRLEGKVAIVTGAGSSLPPPAVGSGRAIALLFAREGAKVVAMDRVEEHAVATLEWLEREGGTGAVYIGDVSRSDDCAAAVAAAVDRFGRLDVLVNNAAINRRGGVAVISDEDWEEVVGVNLTGAMRMSQHAIRAMRSSGGGSIVNISSVGAVRRSDGVSPAYGAAKGGMNSLTTAIAVEEGPNGIRANAIMPGAMLATFMGEQYTDERILWSRLSNPLRREGTGWDIATAALFLASDESQWITGVHLPVDGGYMAVAPIWSWWKQLYE